MTPRKDVDWIDTALDAAGIRAALLEAQHSRLPVAEGSIDTVIGVVQARDIAHALARGEPLSIRALMREAPVVLDQIDAMDALDNLRAAEVPMLLVHDEYGHFEGLVTPAGLLSAIAGEFASDQVQGSAADIVALDDGSLLLDGGMSADTMAQALDIQLPDDRDYATAAGHVLHVLRHLPQEGESFAYSGWLFEVVDMDGRKIDKLRVRRIDDEE
jgi:putative hemolysin